MAYLSKKLRVAGVLVAAASMGCGQSTEGGPVWDVSALTAGPGNIVGNTIRGGGSATVEKVAGSVRDTTDAEFSHLVSRKNAQLAAASVSLAAPVNMTTTQETLSWAAMRDPNAPITLTLTLPEVNFAWDDMRSKDQAFRANRIQQRQADVAPRQQPVIDRLSKLGATSITPLWIANHISAVVPAKLAPAIAMWPELETLEHDLGAVPNGTPGSGYTGVDRASAVAADRLEMWGFNGGAGSLRNGGSSPVIVGDVGAAAGISPGNAPPTNHPGFLKPGQGVTRFTSDLICNSSTKSCFGAPYPTTLTHDTITMQLLAGSIVDGQDPNFQGNFTYDQLDRSGLALYAVPKFFGMLTSSESDEAFAIQQAVSAGVDILNVSATTPGVHYENNPNISLGGLNGALQNAFSSGVLVVYSAGDDNTDSMWVNSPCNQGYPSMRPEVLAVNGTKSVYNSSGYPTTNPVLAGSAWATSGCTVDAYASNGTSTYATTNIALGPVAPGKVSLVYRINSYNTSDTQTGSSFAAPIVAGAAAQLTNAFYSLGFAPRENFWLLTDMMMLSDGYDFVDYNNGAQTRVNGLSQFSGTGRLRMRFPSGGSFNDPNWQWSWWTFALGPHQTFTRTFQIGPNTQHYRLGLFWTETNLTKVADIDVAVNALDANGVLCAQDIGFQDDESLHNSIHLTRSQIPPCAAQLQLVVGTFGMPAGQTRTVYLSDLWDSDSGY
jgi:hypothetical protein